MKHKTILITGGAGFIGSHAAKILRKEGYKVLILDNLSRSHRNCTWDEEFIQGDIGDRDLLSVIFKKTRIDAVMHFAALIDVGESMQDPILYYKNNVSQTLSLLHSMIDHDVKTIIFSSTAAIFGDPQTAQINESHPCAPINPYGISKWIVEKILVDLERSHGLKSCCLRYFNAAGGDPEGKIKHVQSRPSNLIPIALKCISEDTALTIFGSDYLTTDGTCIRDYIHVEDLGTAHLLALQKLWSSDISCSYNLGNGQGYSVEEVIKAVENVTSKKLKIIRGKRRPGDPPVLVADAQLATLELGWIPIYPDLKTMVEHAWMAMNRSVCDD